jgi:hypothetical protein
MKKNVLSFSILVAVFAIFSFSKSLYLVDGNKAMRLGEVFSWSQPYVKLSDVSVALNLKWSYKGRNGVVTNGKDFISFNTLTHQGIYDAIYKMGSVATGVKTPYLSLTALTKLTNSKLQEDAVGYFFVEKTPSLVVNGALLYGNRFTIFFKEKPSPGIVNVETKGMVSTVTIFPISISQNYVPSRSPLVVETRGKNSIIFRITFTSDLNIAYALGYPSLPLQKSKNVDLSNGMSYQSLDYTLLKEKHIKIGVLKIPPNSGKLKIVHPLSGVGEKELITSMIHATCLAAVGFSNVYNGFIEYGKVFSYSSLQNGPVLVWNDQKFDIIETSPTISVNIGDVPFNVDEVNGTKGNVIIYTDEYAPDIAEESNRIYFEIRNGKIVGMNYTHHPEKGEYVLSLTKDYKIFLKNIQLGGDFFIFSSLGSDMNTWNGLLQGRCLLVNNSRREKIWPKQVKECEGKDVLIAALKGKNLYFVKMESDDVISATEMADVMMNMGFFKAMLLDSGKSVSMIVNGKSVEFTNHGLYPVGFGVEIDKTTGGA